MNTSIFTAFIQDLVSANMIARDVGGKWQLTGPILGFETSAVFHSKDELVQKLAHAAASRYPVTGVTDVSGDLRKAV